MTQEETGRSLRRVLALVRVAMLFGHAHRASARGTDPVFEAPEGLPARDGTVDPIAEQEAERLVGCQGLLGEVVAGIHAKDAAGELGPEEEKGAVGGTDLIWGVGLSQDGESGFKGQGLQDRDEGAELDVLLFKHVVRPGPFEGGTGTLDLCYEGSFSQHRLPPWKRWIYHSVNASS